MNDDNATQLLQAQIDDLRAREKVLKRAVAEQSARMAEMWPKEAVRRAFLNFYAQHTHHLDMLKGTDPAAALRDLEEEIEREGADI